MHSAILLVSLAFATLEHGGMLEALKHYELKDYSKASDEFSALLPLRNELAAFNLAVMFCKGEGTQTDLV